jgi:N-acetylglucosamine-6-sulfatase
MRNTGKGLDQTQWTVAKELHANGYNTAVIGKWHLKTTPVGFDHWEIFPGQGSYYNPVFTQKYERTNAATSCCPSPTDMARPNTIV